jgi:hypothetical protein
MTDILGPGSNAVNVVTSRPTDTRVFTGTDTWWKDCSSPAANDGTVVPAGALNSLIAQLRTIIRAPGGIAENNADDMTLKAIRALISAGLSGLQILTAGTNFYVNGTSGNDSNDGLTAGTAFLTLQGAVNKIASGYIALQGVNLYVANGTYSGVTIGSSLVSSWSFIGNTGSPSSVVIDASSIAVNAGRGIVVNGAKVSVNGFSLRAYYELAFVTNGGALSLNGSTRLLGNTVGVFLAAYASSIMYLFGAVAVLAGGAGMIAASGGSTVQLGLTDGVSTTAVAFTFTGTPAFSPAFANVGTNGVISTGSSVCSFSGATTGARYYGNANGVFNTQGAGVNFFPGSTAGSLSTGAQNL